MNTLQQNIEDLTASLRQVAPLYAKVEHAAALIGERLLGGHRVLVAGNGGSAADAMHFAAEFVCRFNRDRRPFPAIALSDAPTVLAIGNDYAFEEVFARQVQAYGSPGDVLLVLSTSGRSKNILQALHAAKKFDLQSIALLGGDGGFCAGLADIELLVPGSNTARIQEAQKLIYHTLCERIELRLSP